MESLLQLAGPIFALVGFIMWSRALFMPKRYYAKRPRWMLGGLACMAIAGLSLWIGYGGMARDVQQVVNSSTITSMLVLLQP